MRASQPCLLGTVAFAALALTPAAHAQTAAAPAADKTASTAEIVVTAQKRAENVQEVPISVTVISADQLARRGVQGIQDLAQASASLEFTAPSAAPGGGAFVRGLGTNLLGGASASPSVGLVLDGVVLDKANVTDIFDTERVEVLKGPQGTLFGSSVSAGVINMTTVAPKFDQFSGYINGELAITGLGSEYARRVVRAAVNVPISETSALRIAVQAYHNDGMVQDVYNGAAEDLSSYAVRAHYKAEIGSAVTFNLIGDYDNIHDNNQGFLVYRAVAPGSPLAQALSACGVTPAPDNTDDCQSVPVFTHSKVGGVSGQFDVALGHATLTSITAWRERKDISADDIEDVAIPFADQYMWLCTTAAFAGTCEPTTSVQPGQAGSPETVRNTLFSQELRAASDANHHLEWVAGLYFQRSTYAENLPSLVTIRPYPPFVPLSDIAVVVPNPPQVYAAHLADYAAFGNVTYYLDSATRLIGGLRYTHSTVSETEADPGDLGNDSFFSGRAKANALTWRAGVQHDVSRATMAYFTASTGYKAPEINDGPLKNAQGTDTLPMNEVYAERPTSFELGIKQSVLGRKLNIDADVFYTSIKNFQSQSCVPSITAITCSDINVPTVHDRGLEWEIFGRPFAGNTVNVSGIYNIAKYPANFYGADGSSLDGQQLNYAPRFKMTVSVEQDIPLTERYMLVFGGDATIRSHQSMYLSANPEFVVPGTTIFNARVSFKSKDRWSFAVFGRNLGNKVYPTQLYPTTAFAQGGLWQVLDTNSRRTVGLQGEFRF